MAWPVGQRAEVSITVNIAEGYGRLHCGDDVHHLSMARGSLAELETPITIAVRPDFIQRDDAMPLWNIRSRCGATAHQTYPITQATRKENPILFSIETKMPKM